MVRNTTGGGNAKKQARKFQNAPAKRTTEVRKSTDPLELYAIVETIHGNGLTVFTHLGQTLWCRVPGKFRGRNRRSNYLEKGKWVLVGLYEWSNSKEPDTCELLCVYDANDIEQLKCMPDVDLKQIISKQSNIRGTDDIDDDGTITFSSNIISAEEAFADNTSVNVAIVNFSADEQVQFDEL
jgi:translation initiation factor IF-1